MASPGNLAGQRPSHTNLHGSPRVKRFPLRSSRSSAPVTSRNSQHHNVMSSSSVRSASPPHEIKLVQRNDSGKHVVLFQSDAAPASLALGRHLREEAEGRALAGGEPLRAASQERVRRAKQDHVTVRYVQRPVRVVIDSLVAPKAGGREFKPEILIQQSRPILRALAQQLGRSQGTSHLGQRQLAQEVRERPIFSCA